MLLFRPVWHLSPLLTLLAEKVSMQDFYRVPLKQPSLPSFPYYFLLLLRSNGGSSGNRAEAHLKPVTSRHQQVIRQDGR